MFLLFAAEGVNGVHDQRRLHADKRAYAGVATFQFLHDQTVFDIRHPRAAITFEAGAIETKIGHGLDQFAREASSTIAFFNDGDEIVFNESAGRVADQALIVREQSVEFDEVYSAELEGHENSVEGEETLEGSKGEVGRQTGNAAISTWQ